MSAEFKFYIISTILVVGGGIQTFSSITDPSEYNLENTQILSRAPAAISNKTKNKAIIEVVANKSVLSDVGSELRPHIGGTVSIDIDCGPMKSSNMKIKANYFLLRGKKCLQDKASGSVEIINKTNGFTASVFQQRAGLYHSDLIQLNSGKNDISIEYLSRKGHKEKINLVVESF